jgi:hypothetical protein
VTNSDPDLEAFARLVRSLTPWLDQVVVIGGWAHRLYRVHPLAARLDYPPLMTLDADVALPSRLKVEGEDIHERLAANGFEAEFLGHHKPPAAHYRLANSIDGFYAEFLAPLVGSTHKRDGANKATTRIAGVTSQRLRYVDLLLHAPWTVVLSESNGFRLPEQYTVRVANPISFLVQKILIHGRRRGPERAKDILYIHDTLEAFGARMTDLRAEWIGKVRSRLHVRSVRLIEQAGHTFFGGLSDAIREAAHIAQGRTLSAQRIREVCNFGFRELFHPSG